jgi:hypothetical protein
MEPFALTLFVLCACTGLVTVALLARWLRSQAEREPDILLEDAPVSNIIAPLAASQTATSRARATVLDDDATQPMTRTETHWAGTEWPSTLPLQHGADAEAAAPTSAERLGAQSAQQVDIEADGYADTQPMPVESALHR